MPAVADLLAVPISPGTTVVAVVGDCGALAVARVIAPANLAVRRQRGLVGLELLRLLVVPGPVVRAGPRLTQSAPSSGD